MLSIFKIRSKRKHDMTIRIEISAPDNLTGIPDIVPVSVSSVGRPRALAKEIVEKVNSSAKQKQYLLSIGRTWIPCVISTVEGRALYKASIKCSRNEIFGDEIERIKVKKTSL
jgi:hypothetical protein